MKNKKPELDIIGKDGNAFAILAKAKKKAKEHNMNWQKIEEEAKSGDYQKLLATMDKYFEVV